EIARRLCGIGDDHAPSLGAKRRRRPVRPELTSTSDRTTAILCLAAQVLLRPSWRSSRFLVPGGDAHVQYDPSFVRLHLGIDQDGAGGQLPRWHRENATMKPPPGGLEMDPGVPATP